MKKPPEKHPSGLTWLRWNWPPLQTETERQMVRRYLKEQWNEERKDAQRKRPKKVKTQIDAFEPALF